MEATLPDRWMLAAGRSASKGCVICRGPRLPGARLCAPCKAALKRARLETVSELIPRPSRAAAEAQEIRRRTKEVAAARAARPRRRWLLPGYFLAAVLVIAGGYLAWHIARPTRDAAVAAPPPPSVPQGNAPIVRTEPAAGAVTSPAKPLVEAPAPRPAPRAAVVPPASRAAPKRAAATPPVPSSPPADRFTAAAPREVPAAVAASESLLPVREAPVPDRWQVMSDQIVRCGREGFLAGVICEQRVRIKYCEGYWGVTAQCPSGIANDHGN